MAIELPSSHLKSSADLFVRPARPSDADVIPEIFGDGFMTYVHPDPRLAEEYGATEKRLHEFVYGDSPIALLVRKGSQFWREYQDTPGQELYVVELEGRAAGYAASKQVELSTFQATTRVAELYDISVARWARRMGAGTELLQAVVDHHEQLGILATFACMTAWAPSRQFYEARSAIMRGPLETTKTSFAAQFGISLKQEGLVILGPTASTDPTLREDLISEADKYLY